ncbi:MAG: hypothetical protein O7C98_05465 [Planctomycetota bacterium]|nr:hypothetical protein [Planctomycetota bacterium]
MTARAVVVALLITCLLPGCVGLAEHAADVGYNPRFWEGVVRCAGAVAATGNSNPGYGPFWSR